MTRTRGVFLVVGIVLVLLLASPFIVLGIWTLLARHRLDLAIADLRAKGEPTTLAEMLAPLIPEDTDAVTLYRKAWTLLEQVDFDTSQRIRELAKPDAVLSPDDVAEVRAFVRSCSQILDLLRQGSLRPACSCPRNPVPGKPGLSTPVTAGLHGSARLLVLSSRVNLADGRADLAFDDCLTVLRLPVGLHDDPLVISALTESYINIVALTQMRSVLGTSSPSADRLRAALPLLEKAAAPGRIARALRGERCFAIATADVLPTDSDFSNLLGESKPAFYRRPFLRARAVDTVAAQLPYLGQLISVAELPWYQAKPRIDELAARVPQEEDELTGFLGMHFFDIMTGAVSGWNSNLARLHLARTAVALRLYRVKNGTYPDSLASLVPDFLDKLPADPFSGNDFVYRTEGPGFILYSLGPNLTDDGGSEDPKARDQGDIVWRCSR